MENNKLFSEFPEISTQQWEEVINADLKGADYEKKLIWKTIEGFDVKPYYRSDNMETLDYLNSNPSENPYTRGHKKDNNTWDIRQDIEDSDLTTANAIALAAIKRGVNSVGFNAKSVATSADLKILLTGIDLTQIKINFIKAKSFLSLIKLFIDQIKSQAIDCNKVAGSINFDPYAFALKKGTFWNSEQANYDELVQIMTLVKQNIPAFDVITVNGNIFNNAGSGIVQQLAFTLSAANDYLYHLTQKGVPAHSIGYRMVFSFATGSNYFMEIAKLRAARLLWTKIMEQYNPQCETAYELYIHTESSFYNKTIYDPYVNMLRTTTETMSSAIAGADSISVYPFDVAFKDASDFSQRIATNQQIILKEESYMDKVIDPAAGSYYIESLTDAIAAKAWEIFKEVEAKGGFVAAIKSGFVQNAIEETAGKRIKDAAMRKATILGTNQYPNLTEEVSKIEKSICGCGDNQKEIKTLCSVRLAEPFEKLRMEIENLAHRPKVFLLTFGNLAMRKARAGFATNLFGVAGYEIIDNLGFDVAQDGAKAALDSQAEIVVLCSSDDEYADLVAKVMPVLKTKVNHVIIAGNPLEQESFKSQGITDFISVKTNVLELLQKYNAILSK